MESAGAVGWLSQRIRLRRLSTFFVALAVVIHEVHQAAHEVDAEPPKSRCSSGALKSGAGAWCGLKARPPSSILRYSCAARASIETVIVCPGGVVITVEDHVAQQLIERKIDCVKRTIRHLVELAKETHEPIQPLNLLQIGRDAKCDAAFVHSADLPYGKRFVDANWQGGPGAGQGCRAGVYFRSLLWRK